MVVNLIVRLLIRSSLVSWGRLGERQTSGKNTVVHLPVVADVSVLFSTKPRVC